MLEQAVEETDLGGLATLFAQTCLPEGKPL
jgi:hypothetical protein